MNRSITINGNSLPYTIIKLRGAKNFRLTLKANKTVRITIPNWASYKAGEEFLRKNLKWLVKKLIELEKKTRPVLEFPPYNLNRYKALKIIKERVIFYAEASNFQYFGITIKNQKAIWGSCSRKKNLNFSYKVAFLPSDLRDYIIVHELCHLRELNHSRKFWQCVATIYPDYLRVEKELKNGAYGVYS